jgi:radical SAM superfamily enzyme YgiQ (UPF0313 family)
MVDIVLVNPNNRILSPFAGIETPLWLGLIASHYRDKGETVAIIDAEAMDWSASETAQRVRELKPKRVIIVVMGNNPNVSSTPKMVATKKLVDYLIGEMPIYVTGLHPSALPHQTKNELGVPVLKGKIFDGLPPVAYDLMPMERYISHNWHCISKGTKVITDKGIIDIENLYNESNISLFGVQNGLMSRFMSRGMQNCVSVLLDNGFELVCTPEHRIKTVVNGELCWREARDFKRGDPIVLLCGSELFGNDNSIDKETAWVLGFLIGDGYIIRDKRGRKRMGFAVVDETGMRLKKYFKSHFDTEARIYPHYYSKKVKVLTIKNGQNKIWDYFKRLVGDNKLSIPEVILRSRRETIESFLEGLKEADGYYSKPVHTYYISTASKCLADGIGLLFLALGKKPYIMKLNRKSNFANAKPIYRVFEDYRQRDIPLGTSNIKQYLKEKYKHYVDKGRNKYGIRQLTLEKLDSASPLLNPLYYYRKVKSVENAGERMVYDLSVPESETFTANGFLVHNCLDGSPREPYASTYTSLNCPFNCDFCNIHALYGGQHKIWYRRPIEVVAEIDKLANEYGVRNIKFWDELFALNKEHVIAICDGLIERKLDLNIWAYARVNTVYPEILEKMHKAGIKWLAYGFESGNDNVLSGVNKKADKAYAIKAVEWTHQAGINVAGNFLFGLPGDNIKSMRETLAFAKSLNIEWANMYRCEVLPGSPLYDRIGKEKQWEKFGQFAPSQIPDEAMKFRDEAFNSFFTDANYLNNLKNKFGEQAVQQIKDMLRYGKPVTRS